MDNYYFDADGFYTHSLPATPGTEAPDDALRVAPELRAGFWPQINATRDGWDQVEDHRQQLDAQGRVIEGSGTAYWLDGDIWQTPARTMTERGPLPDGARLTQPQKTQAEHDAERVTQTKAELATTDTVSVRALRAVLLDMVNGVTPSGDDLARLALDEAEVIALREELVLQAEAVAG